MLRNIGFFYKNITKRSASTRKSIKRNVLVKLTVFVIHSDNSRQKLPNKAKILFITAKFIQVFNKILQRMSQASFFHQETSKSADKKDVPPRKSSFEIKCFNFSTTHFSDDLVPSSLTPSDKKHQFLTFLAFLSYRLRRTKS